MPRSLVVVMIVVVVVVVLHLHLHLHFALCDIPLPLYFIGRKFLRAPRAWLHFSVRGDAIATRCRAKLVAAISSYNYQLR